MSFGGTNNRGPSVAELQRFIREGSVVVFMLANGETVTGLLKWADENAFQIQPEGRPAVTLLRSAVLGYHRSDDGAGSGKKKSAKAGVSGDDGAKEENQ